MASITTEEALDRINNKVLPGFVYRNGHNLTTAPAEGQQGDPEIGCVCKLVKQVPEGPVGSMLGSYIFNVSFPSTLSLPLGKVRLAYRNADNNDALVDTIPLKEPSTRGSGFWTEIKAPYQLEHISFKVFLPED